MTRSMLPALLILGSSAGVFADEVRTERHDRAGGAFEVETITPDDAGATTPRFTPPAPPAPPAPAAAVTGDGVVWERHLTDAIFQSADLTIPGAGVATGTWLNPPLWAEFIPFDGPGVPDWVVNGTDVEAAASRDSDVVAAVDFDNQTTILVHMWRADEKEPQWTAIHSAVRPATFRSVVVSADGSTIVALLNRQTDPARARIIIYDRDDVVPIAIVDAEPGAFARSLAISHDGAYTAVMAGARIMVVERDGTVRYDASAGATNDPVAISGDGDLIAYGWTSMFVREWDGNTYAPKWSRSMSPNTLTACAFSDDGGTLVAASKPSANNRNRIDLFDPASSTPEWTYQYTQHAGQFQDLVRVVDVTADGSHVVAASWGDDLNTNPEVHVFERAGPTPVLTVDTPGSMFDAAIGRDPDGVVRVTAGGKHIHANDNGRGGDLYSIRLGGSCPADVDGSGAVDFLDVLALLADWGPYDPCPPFAPADVDEDCVVGFEDLLAVLAAWGDC